MATPYPIRSPIPHTFMATIFNSIFYSIFNTIFNSILYVMVMPIIISNFGRSLFPADSLSITTIPLFILFIPWITFKFFFILFLSVLPPVYTILSDSPLIPLSTVPIFLIPLSIVHIFLIPLSIVHILWITQIHLQIYSLRIWAIAALLICRVTCLIFIFIIVVVVFESLLDRCLGYCCRREWVIILLDPLVGL